MPVDSTNTPCQLFSPNVFCPEWIIVLYCGVLLPFTFPGLPDFRQSCHLFRRVIHSLICCSWLVDPYRVVRFWCWNTVGNNRRAHHSRRIICLVFILDIVECSEVHSVFCVACRGNTPLRVWNLESHGWARKKNPNIGNQLCSVLATWCESLIGNVRSVNHK